ncbi:TPA: hypothetical protein ACUMPZ_001369 [Haemophilus influenzae]
MQIKKNNNEDVITVLPNGGGTSTVFICIENEMFYSAYITLNIEQARQTAYEILKICDELELENE